MERVLAVMCLILVLSGCEKVVDADAIQLRNGLVYLPNSTAPFTGKVKDQYANGQFKYEKTYKNGELGGVTRTWYENGQLEQEFITKNGMMADGPYRKWHENGQLKSEAIFKNGKFSGVLRIWHENGQLKLESIYKNGEKQ